MFYGHYLLQIIFIPVKKSLVCKPYGILFNILPDLNKCILGNQYSEMTIYPLPLPPPHMVWANIQIYSNVYHVVNLYVYY